MGKKELSTDIQSRIDQEKTISKEDIDTEPECNYCGAEMPYEIYNKTSPQSDYICHYIPGADEYSSTEEILYCDISCFMAEMKKFENEPME